MNRRRKFGSGSILQAVIILVHLFLFPAWGLDPDKQVNQYLVDHWEMTDGIPSNTIYSIAQTPDGYLWVATATGLVRFDGIKFTIFPFVEEKKTDLKNITPEALMVDREGILWIGSSAGLTSYNAQKGLFKTFTTAEGLTADRIRRLKEDMRGNLWITFMASYVNQFSNGKFAVFNDTHGLGGKKVNAIVEDEKGKLLFATRENGVFKYRDGKFFRYPIPDLDNCYINTMHVDKKGELWIATNKGLLRVTPQKTTRYTAREGLSNEYITDIKEDSERNIWVGTQKGLNRIKRKVDGTVLIDRLLESFLITCLFEDREKNLWAGTLNAGIKCLKDGKFISYSPIQVLEEEILLSIFEDQHQDTWIGTLNGKLFRYRGSEFIESLESPKLSGITAVGEDANGNLWLGTNGKGVFQKKNNSFNQFNMQDGLTDNMVTSIYKDSRGNLWFSTFDGVSVFSYPGYVIESFTSRDGLSGKIAHNVIEDTTGNIWIAADKGITVLKDGKIEKPDIKYYLEGVSVISIYEDSTAPKDQGGIYWIATYGAGLKRLRLKDGNVISYTTENGMTTDSIFQFFEDKQGNFWLMGDSGILRINKYELNRFAGKEIDKINCISYGLSDGMKSPEFNNRFSRHSTLKASNGEFWFNTKKGISIVDPDKIRINKVPPPVVIETVLFDQQPVPLEKGPEANIFKGIKNVSFYFTAPTFLSPEKIKFKYQLEGVDREGVYLAPGQERAAHYHNMEPGVYTFRVIACNAEGIWNQKGDSISFTLEPYVYQTLAFKIVVLVMLAVLLTAAVYIYKKRPFEKKISYKDSPLNPHFAEACVKKLNHLVEVEKVHLDENLSLKTLAEKISIPPYQLSQLLNEKLNQNFSDFINYHRIEAAKEILNSPRGAARKNTAVAYDVGFNSMTAFYKAFKKFAGMTPNQYRKEVK